MWGLEQKIKQSELCVYRVFQEEEAIAAVGCVDTALNEDLFELLWLDLSLFRWPSFVIRPSLHSECR